MHDKTHRSDVASGKSDLGPPTIAGTALQADAPCPRSSTALLRRPRYKQANKQTNTPSPFTSAPSILPPPYTISHPSLSSRSSKSSPFLPQALLSPRCVATRTPLPPPPALCDLHPAASPHPSAWRTRPRSELVLRTRRQVCLHRIRTRSPNPSLKTSQIPLLCSSILLSRKGVRAPPTPRPLPPRLPHPRPSTASASPCALCLKH